jgi:prepilin signal peptidase PulO-like enzyme (type II secretory pathway)
MNRKIVTHFVKSLKASCRLMAYGSVGLFLIFYIANYSVSRYFLYSMDQRMMVLNSVIPLILTLFMFVLWRFAKSVEDSGFKKKIPVSRLKVGDMLLKERKLTGITYEQIRKIRKSGEKYVWIKEGVRFAPAVVLALAFTLVYGDALLFFLRLMG